MTPLSLDWLPLCLTVLTLGLRHGLDADHLAAIDGMTRFNVSRQVAGARWCGALFSGGHGAVVILVATTIGAAARSRSVPGWVENFGAWVSIAMLTALGIINLTSVLMTPAQEVVRSRGVRSRVLSHLMQTTHPIGIAAVGALFAVSLDTLSQALLFSATAARFGGWEHALILGCLFTIGMLLVDGINGAWVAAVLRRADRRARIASRAMGLLVAGLSFLVAAIGAVRWFNPDPV
jgi:nickel/cobalt transporter (NiCoT) family protein